MRRLYGVMVDEDVIKKLPGRRAVQGEIQRFR